MDISLLNGYISVEWLYLCWMAISVLFDYISVKWLYLCWMAISLLNDYISVKWLYLCWMTISLLNDYISVEWLYLCWMTIYLCWMTISLMNDYIPLLNDYIPLLNDYIPEWLHWKKFLGRIDFCVESYPVFESSRINYLQDPRPESFWYYSTIHGTRWKFSRWKTEYINELYYIIFDKDGKKYF